MNLKKHRTQIDRVDSEILDLLNRRMNIAKKIALLKKQENKTIYAPQREKKILKSLASLITMPTGSLDVASFLQLREFKANKPHNPKGASFFILENIPQQRNSHI